MALFTFHADSDSASQTNLKSSLFVFRLGWRAVPPGWPLSLSCGLTNLSVATLGLVGWDLVRCLHLCLLGQCLFQCLGLFLVGLLRLTPVRLVIIVALMCALLVFVVVHPVFKGVVLD